MFFVYWVLFSQYQAERLAGKTWKSISRMTYNVLSETYNLTSICQCWVLTRQWKEHPAGKNLLHFSLKFLCWGPSPKWSNSKLHVVKQRLSRSVCCSLASWRSHLYGKNNDRCVLSSSCVLKTSCTTADTAKPSIWSRRAFSLLMYVSICAWTI